MKTTIQVEKSTLEKLRKRKLYSRQSYDEIINRMLSLTKGHKELEK